MSDTFGLKIGVEGEKEFKESLREINQSFKVLASEMTLVASAFDKNDKSVQSLSARNSILNKEIDAQKDKISTLEKALSNATVSFGENDKRTQSWAIQLNKAKAELNGMERELTNNEKTMRDVSRGYDDAGRKLDEYGNEVEDASDKTSIFGEVLKANLAADAIKVGLGALVGLIKEVGAAVTDYINDGSEMARDAAENHAKLTQVMRNTMEASDAEIESIMELARAQERLGVVSATTQVGGAQELGTYLEKTDSLKTLLPVMNDMIAQ